MLANDTIEGTASSTRVWYIDVNRWRPMSVGEHRRQNDFWDKEHKCILRVTPKESLAEKPAVCYLQGEKMWQKLDVNHFEALLS
ncbi:hypothetical protein ARSEF4850_009085 [Beauveria asiatica]